MRLGDGKVVAVAWLALVFAVCCVESCTQQYSRELRYLDYYLGISPANDQGSLPVNEAKINSYVEDAAALNCDFLPSIPCLWTNAPSDGMLDTTEFYLFNKTNAKRFPIQVQPGSAAPAPGTIFIFAGNITNKAQSAVLLSAPIACQSTQGVLYFEYWLYNVARVEVVLLRVNPTRRHLQVILRPAVECHFLKASPICRVEVPRMAEPFRIGIRAFSLRDSAVGSFTMLNRIHYEARVCRPHQSPALFGGVPMTKWLRQRRPISSAADLDCGRPDGNRSVENCLWASVESAPLSTIQHGQQWAIGRHTKKWDEAVRTTTHPIGQFLYQYIDPMAEKPLPQLHSVLVPCTQTPSLLSFRFWMSPSLQAQLCTISADNVPLSCVYLDENDSPGPVSIDIDTADRQPFRFAFSVTRFDHSVGGVIAIDDISYTGYLCHEHLPPVMETTPTPPIRLDHLFELQPFPQYFTHATYSPRLDCDFEVDYCGHWLKGDVGNGGEGGGVAFRGGSQQFLYGHVPEKIPLAIRHLVVGNAAIAVFSPGSARAGQEAVLTSQLITCANNARLTISYYASEGAQLSICAEEKCVSPKRRRKHGDIAVTLNAQEPFRIRLVAAESTPSGGSPSQSSQTQQSFVLVKKVRASEKGFCRLETPSEWACKSLSCDFSQEGPCHYKSEIEKDADGRFMFHSGDGLIAVLGAEKKRAILRSPRFELSSPVELRLLASLSTFGSRLYICPDPQPQQSSVVEVDDCELMLGPKVMEKRTVRLSIQLDASPHVPGLRRFMLVAVHDNYDEFGEAEFTLEHIELVDLHGNPLCDRRHLQAVE